MGNQDEREIICYKIDIMLYFSIAIQCLFWTKQTAINIIMLICDFYSTIFSTILTERKYTEDIRENKQ